MHKHNFIQSQRAKDLGILPAKRLNLKLSQLACDAETLKVLVLQKISQAKTPATQVGDHLTEVTNQLKL